MRNYLDLLREVKEKGEPRMERNGETLCLFGRTLEFNNVAESFPILTTKEVNFTSVVAELLGFIRGADSAKTFRDLGTNIWNDNANKEPNWLASHYRRGDDDLGRIYGVQWRRWNSLLFNKKGTQVKEVDQLQDLVNKVVSGKDERRAIMSAWNPGEFEAMALAPCHAFVQVHVGGGKGEFLDMAMYQRSADLPLGIPYNIGSYATLLSILGQISNRKPRRLLMTLGNVHIYKNQLPFVDEQLSREPKVPPRLHIGQYLRTLEHFEKATPDNFCLMNYHHHGKVAYPFSV
jgi:thymidylate synthase